MLRLDKFLVENGICESRNKAEELIKSGLVKVDGLVCYKSSLDVVKRDVEVAAHEDIVGRGALKLKPFLANCELQITGCDCLDIGASSGGFTQILLQMGAKSVTCIDTGSAQLHTSLVSNPQVQNFENTNIKNFHPDKTYDIVVCDVSFVSLLHILPDIERLASGHIITLFKPQFEVGTQVKRNKKGVVTNMVAIEESMRAFEHQCGLLGWKMILKKPSELSGKEGNIEYFYYFTTVKND